MKTRFWLLLTILLALSLAACGRAATPNPVVTQAPAVATDAPAPTEQNVANEGLPYPAQQAEVQPQPQPQAETTAPYPAPGEAETIEWSQAEEIILSGDVIQIYQTSSLQVTLTLKDGRTLITTEPAYDDVIRVKERCGDKCSQISLISGH